MPLYEEIYTEIPVANQRLTPYIGCWRGQVPSRYMATGGSANSLILIVISAIICRNITWTLRTTTQTTQHAI